VHIRFVAALALTIVVAACGNDNHGTNAPTAPTAPTFATVAVAANPNNVLSAIVTANVTSADSARVSYWTASEAPRYTPYSADIGSNGRLVVLGLRPSTPYEFAIEATNGSGTVTSDTVTLTTGALPAFLANASLAGASPTSGGYILTALNDGSTAYVAAFDSTGHIAWYRAFTDGKPAEEIKQQLNGDITAVLTTSHGGEQVDGEAVAIAPDGSIVRTITAPPSSYLDGHEFWETFADNGDYNGAVFFAYTARHVDLSADGGPADSLITGHQVVQQDASGNQHVLFDAWDHFELTDNVEPTTGQLDFDHPNALSFTSDGNYVVSWRNLDILTKINSSTGELMWTLASPFAARASDFTITGDPLGGFSAQHSLRVLDNGDLLLFDNGTRHVPSASRAVEYALDEGAHTATMVWQYKHTPAYYTAFTGSVQRLENGNTFIGWTFGSPLVATEVTSAGATAWEGTLTAAGAQTPYRFTKIVSLYTYIRP
jgi:arylsulfate sulfotransferase